MDNAQCQDGRETRRPARRGVPCHSCQQRSADDPRRQRIDRHTRHTTHRATQVQGLSIDYDYLSRILFIEGAAQRHRSARTSTTLCPLRATLTKPLAPAASTQVAFRQECRSARCATVARSVAAPLRASPATSPRRPARSRARTATRRPPDASGSPLDGGWYGRRGRARPLG